VGKGVGCTDLAQYMTMAAWGSGVKRVSRRGNKGESATQRQDVKGSRNNVGLELGERGAAAPIRPAAPRPTWPLLHALDTFFHAALAVCPWPCL
jgi:hypothetical protein